ncbi:SAM-dependent methyltransferase [Vagococcus penaei]|uniref:SAM-dependent methyltransferase n=1 Tax=Vagococcus penaei TaxID=633807 RepID=A0A1Q2D5Q5_9ENTE|nr:class I SAM-dependent methyltransferase [Vagococcus penaei]AQP53577.1 SAM-dependent methyltransferase [Vagococcus penaei]RSU07522.1 SAM-dependent methyltransferase [Vagococcus penaei]
MSYIDENKEAWEDAFRQRKSGWGNDVPTNLKNKSDYYVEPCIKKVLDEMDLSNKKIAQFCCNNGRELLSISKHYGIEGTGFDIAENLIQQGVENASILNLPCNFVVTDILKIDGKYEGVYDVILFTVGAITWFEELNDLFRMVSKCLKKDGIMILHDYHPIMNMLPLPYEAEYHAENLTFLENKYFSDEPWIENSGMAYISGEYNSKTFTSFSHSISKIINAIVTSGMEIKLFEEFNYDVGLSDVYNNKGLPLSILLLASLNRKDLI